MPLNQLIKLIEILSDQADDPLMRREVCVPIDSHLRTEDFSLLAKCLIKHYLKSLLFVDGSLWLAPVHLPELRQMITFELSVFAFLL